MVTGGSHTQLHLERTERVFNVLCSFATKLQGHKVKWFTDNQSIVSIITNGSKKPHLQDGALSIFEVCLGHTIKLEMVWLPRCENERADLFSRIVDYDDWKLDPCLFTHFNILWGPHSVDCFASSNNFQLPRFFSKYWCPGSEAVDAFTVDWETEVCWWVPPLYLVTRTIKHARCCSSSGTLVIPMWISAPFWPVICPDGAHLVSFIHCWDCMAYYEGMFKAGYSGSNIANSLNFETLILFLFMDFSVPPRNSNACFCISDWLGSL